MPVLTAPPLLLSSAPHGKLLQQAGLLHLLPYTGLQAGCGLWLQAICIEVVAAAVLEEGLEVLHCCKQDWRPGLLLRC